MISNVTCMSTRATGFKTRFHARKAARGRVGLIRPETALSEPRPADNRPWSPYGGQVSPTEPSDTWGTLVRRNRLRLQMSQERLAEAVGVVLKTVYRWETRGSRPDSYETAMATIKALGLEPDSALRLAGYGQAVPGDQQPDPYAYVREMGLDPANRVVRRILSLRVDDEFRMRMLRRERQLQIRDEQARLDDIEWTLDQQHRDDDQRQAS